MAWRYSWRSACARAWRGRQALAGIERAELDAGGIGGARHDAAQGIDLADQMALADATDGGIAAHRTDGLDALREQQRACATARRSQRRFHAGMPAAHHDHVVFTCLVHGAIVGRLRRLPSVMVWLPPVPHRNFLLLASLLVLAGPVGVAAQSSPASTPFTFSPCRLEHPSGLASVEAECGHMTVPENRAVSGGRQLQLFVARIPSLSRRHAPEPVFVLAGGPGLGASTFYAGVAPAFARIRRNHDIVIVDQRGTGRSHPLNCPVDEQQLWDASEADTAKNHARLPE